MTPERYGRIAALFDAAVDVPREARAAFLRASSGGDEALAEEVEALLAHHDASSEFLGRPALDVAALLLKDDHSALIGQQVDHYAIRAWLGAGGMGRVYLAEDLRLMRPVAIKLLLPGVHLDATAVRRFQRESQAILALNHPNVLTVHDVGTSNGVPYLVTEFVPGHTLRARLQTGAMPVAETLDIAEQTLAALVAAHDAGVVHRDLKPENLLLRPDGVVKVLDFGLAKLTDQTAPASAPDAAGHTVSIPGRVLGTVAYMSPEQARGAEVDHRSDLFSLGVMIHEMLSGRRPFTGDTPNHVIVALIDHAPPPLPPTVPAAVAAFVTRLMDKRPEARSTAPAALAEIRRLRRMVADAADTADAGGAADAAAPTAAVDAFAPSPASTATTAIETRVRPSRRRSTWIWVAAAAVVIATVTAGVVRRAPRAAAPPINAIAVLPFTNVGGNEALEYVSDGITESLIHSLSRVRDLRVIARSSAFRYKGQTPDPQTVASALGVAVVLSGSVEQRGNDLIVNAELVRGADRVQLWGDRYERPLGDLAAVQADLAGEIVTELRPALDPEERDRVSRRPSIENESYRLYLQGRYLWNKRSPETAPRALALFEEAVARDPSFALAWVGLADAQTFMGTRGRSRLEEYRRARVSIDRALAIDDRLGEAHATQAMLTQNTEWDFAAAEALYRRSLELNPSYATAHHWYGEMLLQLGRPEEALTYYRRGLELDPLSLALSSDLGLGLFYARRFDEARTQLQRTIALDPTFVRTYFYLARLDEQEGRFDDAIAHYREGFTRFDEPRERVDEIVARLAAGRAAGARGYWTERLRLKSRFPGLRSEWECDLAGVQAHLGDADEAFAALDQAFQAHLFDILFLKASPEFDSLRADPRYVALARRIGLP